MLAVLLLLSGGFSAIVVSFDAQQGRSLPYKEPQQPAIWLNLNVSFSKKSMENDRLWLDYAISGQGKELVNASLAILATSHPGRTYAGFSTLRGFAPSLGEYKYVPEFMFQPDYLLTFNPEFAPYDLYEAPKLVIGTDEEVSVFDVWLTYELPSGYTASIRELRRMTLNELMQTLGTIDSKLPAAIEESVLEKRTHFLYVDFVIVHTFNQIMLLTVYLLSASYILYTCFILALRIPGLEDRLKIFAGAGIGLFAFIWGLRQVLPSRVTYWEGVLLATLFVWALVELYRGRSRDSTQRTSVVWTPFLEPQLET
jgi:hypothetical protein